MDVRTRGLAVLAVAFTVTGCGGGLATVGASVPGATTPSARAQSGSDEARATQFNGEIREVYALQQRTLLSKDDGRSGSVRYDAETFAVRGLQHHPELPGTPSTSGAGERLTILRFL